MVLGEAGIQPVYTNLCSKEGDWDLVEDKKDDYSDVEWVLSSHDHSEQGQGHDHMVHDLPPPLSFGTTWHRRCLTFIFLIPLQTIPWHWLDPLPVHLPGSSV